MGTADDDRAAQGQPTGTTPAEETPEASSGERPADPSDLVVVRMDEDDEDEASDSIEHPARLLRLATMAQRIMKELRDMDIDEAGRERVARIYDRTLDQLGEVLSKELRDELSELVADSVGDADGPPSKAELQLVHAQLVGWLEGLFQGIQASIASQQMAAQQQLARLKQQGELGSGERPSRSGTYL